MTRWENIHKQIAYLVHTGGYSRADALLMSPFERNATYDYIVSQLEKAYKDIMNKNS